VIFSIILKIVNPGLIAERLKPGVGRAGSSLQDWQQHPDGSDAGCGRARCWPVPLDRSGGPWLPIAALVIVVLGYLFLAWATLTNRFFS